MSRYSLNEEELRKGQQLLLHVGNKLDAMIRNVETARESLVGYSGYGIERQRYTLETQKNVLVLQIENVERLRTCIQQVMDRTRMANQEAKAELQNSELNTGFQTAASIIAAEQAKKEAEERKRREAEERKKREEEERKKAQQQAQENRRPGNAGVNQGSGLVSASRATTYYAYGKNSQIDKGCAVYAMAMILANLGVATNGNIVVPENVRDKYGLNFQPGGLVFDRAVTYSSRPIADIGRNEKVEAVREALKENPQGVILGFQHYYADSKNSSIQHFVVATGVDSEGNIIINDPYYVGREGMKLAECNYAAIREIHMYK